MPAGRKYRFLPPLPPYSRVSTLAHTTNCCAPRTPVAGRPCHEQSRFPFCSAITKLLIKIHRVYNIMYDYVRIHDRYLSTKYITLYYYSSWSPRLKSFTYGCSRSRIGEPLWRFGYFRNAACLQLKNTAEHSRTRLLPSKTFYQNGSVFIVRYVTFKQNINPNSSGGLYQQ